MFKIMNKSPLRTQSHTNPNIIRFNPSPKTPFVEQTKIISPVILNPINASYFSSEKRDNSAQMRMVPMSHDQQSIQKGPLGGEIKQNSHLQSQTQSQSLYQNEIKLLKEKCQTYEQELTQKTKEINQLKDRLNNQNNISFSSGRRAEEMLLNENEELRQLVISHQEQVKLLRKEKEIALMELHNKINEQNREIDECRRLTSIYESLKEENETLLRMLSQKDQEIESMMSHFQIEQEINQKQIQQLKQKFENEVFMQNHIQQIDEANQEINRCLSQIESQSQEILELEEMNRNFQRENQELHEGIDSKNQQIDDMVLKYGKINFKSYCTQENQMMKYENQIQDLKEQVIDLNQYQQHREQLIQTLVQELETLKMNNDLPNSKEQDIIKRLSESHYQEIAKLRKELQDKIEEINRNKSQKQ